MKRPVNLGSASLKALAAVVALGAVAHAGLPYLPLIGPPPLRVQAAKSPVVSVVQFEAQPAVAVTNSNPPPVVVSKEFPGTTNATGGNVAATPLPMVASTPEESLGQTINSSVFALSTPELMGITPQMLATYFHPVQIGTNTALTGPFRISFLPPVTPEKSSHAEYIIK
jgi:hypothetical protein